MKKFLILIVIIIAVQVILKAQPCLQGGKIFTTQAQIDSFPINYPNCTEIEGNILIRGDSINNLNALNILNSINGYLSIEANHSLINLSGLEELKSVGFFNNNR